MEVNMAFGKTNVLYKQISYREGRCALVCRVVFVIWARLLGMVSSKTSYKH